MTKKINKLARKVRSGVKSASKKVSSNKVVKGINNKFLSKVFSFQGIKIVFIVLFGLSMLTLALPEFKFKVGDSEFTYPGIGFSRIGLPVDFPSFTEGKDIFGSQEFIGEFNFGEAELREDQKSSAVSRSLEIIRDRINFAGFSDMEVTTQKINEKYFLSLKIPNNYNDAEQYARWIIGRGVVSFENFQLIGEEFSENPILINDTDIKSVNSELNVRYSRDAQDANGNNVQQTEGVRAEHLVFTIDSSKISEVAKLSGFIDYAQTLNSGQPYLTNIVFDGFVSFNIFKDDFSDGIIRAFPQGSLTNITARDQMKVVQSYLRSKPLDFEIKIDDASPSIPVVATYNPEGGSLIAIAIFISFIGIAINFIRQIGFRKTFQIIFAWTLTMLTAINLGKLMLLPINLGTVLSFSIFGLFTLFILKELFERSVDEFRKLRRTMLHILVILLFIIAGITSSTYSVENIREFTSVIIVFALSVSAFLYTLYEFTFNNFSKQK